MKEHSDLTGEELHFCKVKTGATPPTAIVPDFSGQIYVDEVHHKSYVAYGTLAGYWIESEQLINVAQLDPVNLAVETFAVPFFAVREASGLETTVFTALGYKVKVLDAKVISTAAGNTGTWKLTDGASTDITSAIALSSSLNGVSRAALINDSASEIAANESLVLELSVADDACVVHVTCIRVD